MYRISRILILIIGLVLSTGAAILFGFTEAELPWSVCIFVQEIYRRKKSIGFFASLCYNKISFKGYIKRKEQRRLTYEIGYALSCEGRIY